MLGCLRHLATDRAVADDDLLPGSCLVVATEMYVRSLRKIQWRTAEVVRGSVCVLTRDLPTDEELREALTSAHRAQPTLSPRALFQLVNEELNIDGWTLDMPRVKETLTRHPVVIATVRTCAHVITLVFTRKTTLLFDVAGMHDLRGDVSEDPVAHEQQRKVRELVESLIGCSVRSAKLTNMPKAGENIDLEDYLDSKPIEWTGPKGSVCVLNCLNLQELRGSNDDMCLLWTALFTWTLSVFFEATTRVRIERCIYECSCVLREYILVKDWGERVVTLRQRNFVLAFDIVCFGNISEQGFLQWCYLDADRVIGDFFMDIMYIAEPDDEFDYDALVSKLQYKGFTPVRRDPRFDSLVVAALEANVAVKARPTVEHKFQSALLV